MRVPVYNQSEVQTVGQPSPVASGGGVTGEGLAKGLQQTSGALWEMAAQEKKKADEKALFDARVKMDDLESSVSFGDDETEGFLSLRGQDAHDRVDAYLDDFKEKLNQIRDAAANDDQRNAIDVLARDRERTVERNFRGHAAAQFQVAVDQSNQALIESSLRNIGNYYNDERRFGQELAFIRGAIQEDTTNKGQTPELALVRLQQATDAAYEARVRRMAINSPVQAKEFLDSIQGRFPNFDNPQGLVTPGNIDLGNRPQVQTPEGGIATVRSISIDQDGKEVLIPTVSPDGKLLTNQQAVDLYRRTGQHLGIFDSVNSADRYAQALHEQQAYFYGGNKPAIMDSQTESSLYAMLKPMAANQEGINAAESLAPRLYKEDYTTLRAELFKQMGGGTSSFKADAFKVAEAQLLADNQAIKVAQQQNLEKLQVPVWQAILNAEKSGAKMAPAQLSQLPEFQAMQMSGDPNVVKAAAVIMDHVYTEHHQMVVEARAEARANKVAAAETKRLQTEQQREAFLTYYSNPDAVAAMSKADVLQVALKLGPYGDDLLKMHQKATSPESLADVKVESSTFKNVMETLKVPKDQQGQVMEAMKQYLVREQQDQKRVLNKEQIRQAIASAVSDVTVNQRRQTWWGTNVPGSLGQTSTTMPLYQVQNPDAIVIPKDQEAKISALLQANGITDNRHNRLRVFKEFLSETGTAKLRGM